MNALQVFATISEAFLRFEDMCANNVGHCRVAIVTPDQYSAEQSYQNQPTAEEVEQALVTYNQRMFDLMGEPPVPPKDAVCETCKGCLYNDLGERVRCSRSVGIVHEKIEQVHYTIYENCVGLCREADEEESDEEEDDEDRECDAYSGGGWFCHDYENCDYCDRKCRPDEDNEDDEDNEH